jgi:Protein of unknown function (DUF2568)
VTRAALAIGTPLVAAVLWGLFAAPRATFSIPLASVAVQLVVFGSATVALYAAGRHVLAITFVVLVVAMRPGQALTADPAPRSPSFEVVAY